VSIFDISVVVSRRLKMKVKTVEGKFLLRCDAKVPVLLQVAWLRCGYQNSGKVFVRLLYKVLESWFGGQCFVTFRYVALSLFRMD